MSVHSILRNERGETLATNISVYVTIALIAFFSWKILVPVFRHMLFDQYVEKQANWDRENSVAPPTLETLDDQIREKARKLGVVIHDRKLVINYENPILKIAVDYHIPVNLYLYKFDWNFQIERETQNYR